MQQAGPQPIRAFARLRQSTYAEFWLSLSGSQMTSWDNYAATIGAPWNHFPPRSLTGFECFVSFSGCCTTFSTSAVFPPIASCITDTLVNPQATLKPLTMTAPLVYSPAIAAVINIIAVPADQYTWADFRFVRGLGPLGGLMLYATRAYRGVYNRRANPLVRVGGQTTGVGGTQLGYVIALNNTVGAAVHGQSIQIAFRGTDTNVSHGGPLTRSNPVILTF